MKLTLELNPDQADRLQRLAAQENEKDLAALIIFLMEGGLDELLVDEEGEDFLALSA